MTPYVRPHTERPDIGASTACALPHRKRNPRGRQSDRGIDRRDLKGSVVKTISVCVLLGLLSIVAYSGFSDSLSPTRNDNRLAANLPTYVFLHKAWNENTSPTAAGLSVCTE